jgi:hypothetical protein
MFVPERLTAQAISLMYFFANIRPDHFLNQFRFSSYRIKPLLSFGEGRQTADQTHGVERHVVARRKIFTML